MLHRRRSAMASRGEPGSADEQLNQMIAERRSETGHGSETQPLDFGPLGQLPPIAAGSLLSGLNNVGSFLGSAPASGEVPGVRRVHVEEGQARSGPPAQSEPERTAGENVPNVTAASPRASGTGKGIGGPSRDVSRRDFGGEGQGLPENPPGLTASSSFGGKGNPRSNSPGNLVHSALGSEEPNVAHGALGSDNLAHGVLGPGNLGPGNLAHGVLGPGNLAHSELGSGSLAHGALVSGNLAHGALGSGALAYGASGLEGPANLAHGALGLDTSGNLVQGASGPLQENTSHVTGKRKHVTCHWKLGSWCFGSPTRKHVACHWKLGSWCFGNPSRKHVSCHVWN